MAAWGWTTDTVYKPAALGPMRRSLRRWLERHEVADNLDELVLVASELTTNAIQASAQPSDPVSVRVAVDGDLLVVAVANIGPLFVLPPVAPREPEAVSGRGLVIVQSLTERMQISRDGRKVVVSVWRRLS